MKRNINVLHLTLVVALGGLLFGYDTAVISGATEALQHYFQLTAAELGFAASSALIGCVIGAILSGDFSTRYGRRGALKIAALLFLISAIGSAIPESYWTFVIYRIIGGIGVGIASMVSPMYIAEVAPPKKRGGLVACNQFAIIFGMLVVYFVNYGIALIGTESWLNVTGWRYMFASEVIPAALFLVLLFTVPETPRWLVLRGRNEEAYALLNALNKGAKSDVEHQWQEIQSSFKQRNNSAIIAGGFMGVLVIGIMLSVLQQVTGINVFLYYAPTILKGFSNSSIDIALLQTILVGAVNLSFTVVAILTVDKFGRRPLMMIGASLMAVSMIAIGTAAYMNAIGGYLLVFVLLYIGAFALSLGPVVWVLLSEIFPNNIRSKALSIAVFAQWAANFFVSQTFPMMNDPESRIYQTFNGGFPFWLYGIMGIFTIYFIYRWVPETKGRSLEELEALWEKPATTNKEQVIINQ
ncbi:MFS transporter [Vibrio cincinnatiensis]|jgi:SP family xylose:H+ symportor-like MFS transporter|uniref:D-xylose-proton symporter n=1 Tax=Vibrio cincinnatiensis DSM 19608 TaxID=1123491 RepID=A0A1T4QL76_VIBCI|nr:sugar porter family MFS transporter [Vibrio cincinnatiensis]SKA04465.1 MFS transporter, SP family, xylose:H+ symportor [Vibrio cincinnatiensis DSM 19608]SUP49574.1 MFS transporter [Vibrio cincinnatiensis]